MQDSNRLQNVIKSYGGWIVIAIFRLYLSPEDEELSVENITK